MRLILTIATLFIFTATFCQHSSISGTIIDTTTKKPLAGAKVTLLLKTNSQYTVIAVDSTGPYGTYNFKNVAPGKYKLICFYKIKHSWADSSQDWAEHIGRYGVDSNILISHARAIIRNFYLPVTCVYDKTKDQAFCPVCKKTDMVKPILWGLPVLDLNGNYFLPEGKTINDYYLGGCVIDGVCDATKHCNRCDAYF